MRSITPASIALDAVAAAPMVQTATLSAESMSSRTPQSEIQGLHWAQLPGSAQDVAASPDGSIWVISNVSSGSTLGNSIWHYAGGTWTNIPGLATRLAAAPDNTIWAINGAGTIYHYQNGSWHAISGSASDLSVAADGSLYVISNRTGNAYGNAIYHYANGNWTQSPGAAVRIAASWDTGGYPGIGPGGFYVVNAKGWIYYDDPTTGYVRLPQTALQVAPTTNGGFFALGTPATVGWGNPIYYDDLNASSWTLQPGAAVSIATAGTTVFAVNAVGAIYKSIGTITLYNLTSGSAFFGSFIYGIATGPDGNLWFTGYDASKIGKITPGGTITAYTIPNGPSSFPFGITAGPDGSLWFTQQGRFGNGNIGRITTSGTITEYGTPTYPTGITVGPDGNLWFTESFNGFSHGAIGKITTGGTITEYPTSNGALAITAGSDGNLWFTEEDLAGNAKIGKITTGGTITEYPIPTAGEYLGSQGITAGPDGNVWFTDLTAGKIGKITTAGTITEYPISSCSCTEPGAITAGPDGNLWFTQGSNSNSNTVAKITTGGTVTEYPLSGVFPSTITAGPDGNMWFAAYGSIGEIAP